jgi:hypothetical protein
MTEDNCQIQESDRFHRYLRFCLRQHGPPDRHDRTTHGALHISGEPAVKLFSVPYAGEVSRIVWDNISKEQQASNLYFSTLGNVTQGTCVNERCAVKLSQQNLQ